MTYRKLISILVVVGFLLTTFPISTAGAGAIPDAWNEGQVWGYKWQLNIADLKSEIENRLQEGATIDEFNISGGYSELFYIEYLGNTSEGYKFEFKGGSYEEVHTYIKTGSKTSNDQGTGQIDEYASADYIGTFWLTAYPNNGVENEEQIYYGMTKMMCTVSLDINISFNLKNGDNDTYFIMERGKVEYNSLELDFSPPIPLLPIDTENPRNPNISGVNVTYSGDRNGHLVYVSEQNGVEADSANQNLSKHINGQESMYISNYTMPILILPGIGMLQATNGEFEDINIGSFTSSSVSMKYSNDFVSSITQSSYISGLDTLKISSQPATEEEVNQYLQNKKAHTPGIELNADDTSTQIDSENNNRCSPRDWHEGPVWGYKWQYNLADLKSEVEHELQEDTIIDAFDLNGGYSEFFYIKYLGNTSEGCKFEFKGGSYEEVNSYIKGRSKTSDEKATGQISGYVSADYSGTFWLTEYYENGGNHGDYNSYYGISKMVCTASFNVDLYFNIKKESSDYVYEQYAKEKGYVKYDDLELDFSPSIPVLPSDMENPQTPYVDVHITYIGNRSGHLTYENEYSSSYENETQKDSADENLSKHINGQKSMYISNYTMPILIFSGIGMLRPIDGKFEDINIDNYNLHTVSMKYSNDFITSITQSGSISGLYSMKMSSQPATEDEVNGSIKMSSQPATEDEVNEYLQDKKAHTPGVGNGGTNFLLIGSIIGIIAVVAVIAAVVFMRRKKRMPPEMYGAYPQNTYEGYPPQAPPPMQEPPNNPVPQAPPQDDFQEPPRF